MLQIAPRMSLSIIFSLLLSRTSSFNFFLSFTTLAFLKNTGQLLHKWFLSLGFVFCPHLLDPGYEFLVGKPCK